MGYLCPSRILFVAGIQIIILWNLSSNLEKKCISNFLFLSRCISLNEEEGTNCAGLRRLPNEQIWKQIRANLGYEPIIGFCQIATTLSPKDATHTHTPSPSITQPNPTSLNLKLTPTPTQYKWRINSATVCSSLLQHYNMIHYIFERQLDLNWDSTTSKNYSIIDMEPVIC